MSGDTRAAARAFVRSLNILLKFARLYEFGHARTGAQFETAWKELRSALDESSGSGLLLGLKCVVPNGGMQTRLREAGLLAVAAGDNVIRLLPPLTVGQTELDAALDMLERVARNWFS